MTADALRRSPLLEGLPETLLDELSARGTTVELADGAVLMEEGSPADAMYIVLEGSLEARRRIDGAGQVVIGTIAPGEVVGEMALLHGRPRSAEVGAVGPTRLLRIDGSALDELLAHRGVSRAMLATATKRLETQELLLRQHGRMAALGTLTAGLLHELNNPAAAVRRAVDHLATDLTVLEDTEAVLASSVPELRRRLSALAADLPAGGAADGRSPLARAAAEEALRTHLERRGVPAPWELAGQLARSGVDVDAVEALLGDVEGEAAKAALAWLAARLRSRQLLAEAAAGAGRLAEIVGAVKAYSHHGEAAAQDVAIHDGLEAALTLLQHKIPPGVRIIRRYDPDLPTIEGFPGDLNSVWTNLLDNALDAVGATGEVELATATAPAHVTVTVTDDGPGIPPDVRSKLFDPFFTTKPVGAGTGLGLATAWAVVTQRHHGTIEVASAPGRTTFTVTLPRAADGPGPRIDEQQEVPTP
jgi:signal transduction histidine kinase